MTEILLAFDKESPIMVKNEVNIEAIHKNENEDILYKFMVSLDGVWSTLRDFSKENKCNWKPEKSGKYMVMVQAKEVDSTKPFDCVARGFLEISPKLEIEEKLGIKDELEVDSGLNIASDLNITTDIEIASELEISAELEAYSKLDEGNNGENKLIYDIKVNSNEFFVSDKLTVEVVSNLDCVLYRFWMRSKQGWELIRDYTGDKTLNYTCNDPGSKEILVEAKLPTSDAKVDEFTTIRFKVKDHAAIEIVDFVSLSDSLLVNEELAFKVTCNHEEHRNLLYKFLKVDAKGKVTAVQDYSSKKIVTFKENKKGEYKLLCLVRDMFSEKEYDDRAYISYEVKPYEDIHIKKLSSDLISPQVMGAEVIYTPIVEGGNEVLYKYVIEGTIAEETSYTRNPSLIWHTKEAGNYKITLFVKDLSFDGDYEDKHTVEFVIDKKGDKPARIQEVVTNVDRHCVVGMPVNIKVMADGGTVLKYSFIVYKDGKEKERIDYGSANWVNFTPEEKGNYEIEVRVVDKYSKKEYDCHSFIQLKVREYMPAEIDYVLTGTKENYIVGDIIDIEIIIQNTKKVLLKYVTKINGREIEDTGYVDSRKLKIKPKVEGKYTFEIYAKNIKCKDSYDSKKIINIYVQGATPIRDTKIEISKDVLLVNEEITFNVESKGGKEVCYEFYIMERGSWVRAQEYSRKRYYTFLPFSKGKYRVLVLSKSYHKKVKYEDYCTLEFIVE